MNRIIINLYQRRRVIRTEVSSDYINETDYELAVLTAHPVRVALVRYLAEKNKGKVDNVTCNKDLVELLQYSQSTISQHVKIEGSTALSY